MGNENGLRDEEIISEFIVRSKESWFRGGEAGLDLQEVASNIFVLPIALAVFPLVT